LFLDEEKVFYVSSNKDWLKESPIELDTTKNIYREGKNMRRMQGYYEQNGDTLYIRLENPTFGRRYKNEEAAYNNVMNGINGSSQDIMDKDKFENILTKSKENILTLICKITPNNELVLIKINNKTNTLKFENNKGITYELNKSLPFELVFTFQKKDNLTLLPPKQVGNRQSTPNITPIRKPTRGEIKSW
ncbi:MAG: hypothetical protein RLZZ292_1042, partial [Bacteroidota bacterium]